MLPRAQEIADDSAIRGARVYRAELHGTVPQRVVPYNPGGSGRHLHYVEDGGSRRRKPELKGFYESVARTLRDAEQILVFGVAPGREAPWTNCSPS